MKRKTKKIPKRRHRNYKDVVARSLDPLKETKQAKLFEDEE